MTKIQKTTNVIFQNEAVTFHQITFCCLILQ